MSTIRVSFLLLVFSIAACAAEDRVHVLENDRVRFAFAEHRGRLTLSEILDKATVVQFIETNLPPARLRNLWQASLRSADAMTGIDETGDMAVDRRATDRGEELVFQWQGLAIEDRKGLFDVTMTVLLPRDSALAEWRIRMVNRSDKFGIWIAKFPNIVNLKKLASADAPDFLAIPGGNGGGAGEGQLYRDPFQTLHPFVRTYPCYHQSMQFNAYYGAQGGLYLATHDGDANLKGFLFKPMTVLNTPVMTYEVQNYPPDSGVAGTGYAQEFATVIGPFAGDWYDAARIYRAWALQQKWCRLGPTRDRTDITPAIKNGAYWMMAPLDFVPSNEPHMRKLARTLPIEEVQKRARTINVESTLAMVREAHQYFGYPMILWCNEWFDGGGDTSPPRYVPMNRLDAYLAALHKEFTNVLFSAHIQPKRYSTQVREYDQQVIDSLEKTPGGQLHIGPVMPGESDDVHAYPCWATKWWQDFWADKTRARAKLGIDGFHIDELGSATSFDVQCFNRDHGHPIGGGTLYAETRRNMVTVLRENGRKVRPDFAAHHEVLNEIYIDVADAAEVCTSPSNHNIPLYEAVYHDYNFIMGRRIMQWNDRNLFPKGRGDGDANIDEFVASFGETYVWGNQPGWTRIDIASYAPKVAAIIKQFMDARYRAMKFLNFGDMMRPLRVVGELPRVTNIWRYKDTPEHTQPAILNSVWKAADGTAGIVLVNITGSEQTIRYRCDLAECGITAGKVTVTRIDGEKPVQVGESAGAILERTDSVGPRSVAIFEVAPLSR